MSYRKERFKSTDVSDYPTSQTYLDQLENQPGEDDLRSLFLDILSDGVHGLCFSLYEEGQKPGDLVSEDQIRRRMQILAPHTSSIRSFSCTEGNEIIPKIAKEFGLKTLVGAWLGSDKEKNEEELQGLEDLANQGLVDIAAVGNEVLYRNDLSEDELTTYLEEIKQKIPDTPVGYVDAYYEFVARPKLVELSDVILCNCYPYWEGTEFKYSLRHMQHMYEQVVNMAQGKPVYITETGWPSAGKSLGGAVPSQSNAMKYFINTYAWAKSEGVGVYYFSSFDESWKIGNEGDVGAYWGIWDKNGNFKY